MRVSPPAGLGGGSLRVSIHGRMYTVTISGSSEALLPDHRTINSTLLLMDSEAPNTEYFVRKARWTFSR
jgi:hypothetical protein